MNIIAPSEISPTKVKVNIGTMYSAWEYWDLLGTYNGNLLCAASENVLHYPKRCNPDSNVLIFLVESELRDVEAKLSIGSLTRAVQCGLVRCIRYYGPNECILFNIERFKSFIPSTNTQWKLRMINTTTSSRQLLHWKHIVNRWGFLHTWR